MCPRLAQPRMVSAVVGTPRARSCLAICSAPCRGSGWLASACTSGGCVHRLMVRAWSSSSCMRSAAQSSSDSGWACQAMSRHSRGAVKSASLMWMPIPSVPNALSANSRRFCSIVTYRLTHSQLPGDFGPKPFTLLRVLTSGGAGVVSFSSCSSV